MLTSYALTLPHLKVTKTYLYTDSERHYYAHQANPMLNLGLGSALVSFYGCSFSINTIHIHVTYEITFMMHKSRGVG